MYLVKVIVRTDITDCIMHSSYKIRAMLHKVHIVFPISCTKQSYQEKSYQIPHSLDCL